MGCSALVKIFGGVVLLLSMGGALAACASQPGRGESVVTPQQVSEKGDSLFEAVTAVLGREGWDQDSQWFACDASGGANGVVLRREARLAQPSQAEPEEMLKRVQDAWGKLGVHAETAVDTTLDPVRYILSDPPYLSGVNSDGSLSDLWIGTGIVNFSYVSPCVPGDIFELQPQMTSTPEPTVTPPSTP